MYTVLCNGILIQHIIDKSELNNFDCIYFIFIYFLVGVGGGGVHFNVRCFFSKEVHIF